MALVSKKKMQYFYEKELFLRDTDTYYQQSKQAEITKEKIYGHKGELLIQHSL